MVLLVAMIGAIVLTLSHRTEGVKRQNIPDQVRRRREDGVEIKQVETGKGI